MNELSKELILDIYEKVSNQSDKDWSEICNEHQLSYHADTLRKAGLGIKMAADAGVLNFDKASVDAYAEVYKAKRQFYDQRREYNNILTEQARNDHLASELIRAANSLNEKVPLGLRNGDVYVVSDNEAVLVLCDWHFGLTTDNIWNKYNPDIADRRIAYLRTKVFGKLQLYEVQRLHVVVLGDMISGAIHTSVRVKSCEDTVDQVMNVSERLAELVDSLLVPGREIMVYCTYGNHARVTSRIADSVHSDNIERLIPFWLKQRFKESWGVHIIEGEQSEILDINPFGHGIGAVHGDLDSSKDAMLTLSVLYEKLFGRKMEYMIAGHLHHSHYDESLGIEQIGVGSLCGTDDYAKNKRLFSKPSQTLLIFDRMGLDSIHNIDLSPA